MNQNCRILGKCLPTRLKVIFVKTVGNSLSEKWQLCQRYNNESLCTMTRLLTVR
ncbi:hypothetical protein [Klebsiella pneumoniae]|uniref:hypothetical protein n=1 Tax=Klebsiella pneumoniae TaxID=573 RepID=UPI00388FC071